MSRNSRLITTTILVALFLGSTLSVLPIGHAATSGTLAWVKPDLVAPGGPIELDASGLSAGGASVYFYLSDNGDSETTTGDIYAGKVATADLDVSITIWVPSATPAGDYYIKATDIQGTGKSAVVTGDTVEVVTEYPSVTINADDTPGNFGDYPEIAIKSAGDYDAATIYWDAFSDDGFVALGDVIASGKYTINADTDDWAVPDGYKGDHKVIIYLEGADSFATYVTFTMEPSADFVSIAAYSIAADAANQVITITGHGFPKGTIDKDTGVVVTSKSFAGSNLWEDTAIVAADVDVGDGDPDAKGYFTLDARVDGVDAGTLSVEIKVDSTSNAFDDVLLSSKASTDFTQIKDAKLTKTEAINGKTLGIWMINLPASENVLVEMIGTDTTADLTVGTSDENGAFKEAPELDGWPGDTYQVRATVGARTKIIGTFKILPDFEVQDEFGDALDATTVETLYQLSGTGFPVNAELDYVYWGTKKIAINFVVDVDGLVMVIENADGDPLAVPHVSGGGKAVAVKMTGTDVNLDKAIEATSSVVIDPFLLAADDADNDVGFLDTTADPVWTDFDAAPLVFPGHPVKIVGFGYLADETVTVKLYDGNDKLLGTATITSGGKTGSDGDLTLVCWLPAVKAMKLSVEDAYLTVAGSGDNTADSETFTTTAIADDDSTGMLIFGIEDDGDIDTSVKVDDVQNVAGVGFWSTSVDLRIGEDKQKSVSVTYGYFKTTMTIPELEGSLVGTEYTFDSNKAAASEMTFIVKPKIVASPVKGYADSNFVITGKGFTDGEDVSLVWSGTDEELDAVDGADIDTGTFTMTLTVPAAVAQAYKISAIVTDETWASTTYTVLDENAANTTKTLDEIIAMLGALNIPQLNTNIQATQTAATAAGTKADAAATAATAAGTKADAATAAATAAGSKADAATAAAIAAGTKADAATAAATSAATSAKSAADAASGLTTLVYAAIGASLVAALAAIVALMQISRKIA
ncbi:MAG: hypothetical protein NTV61_04270 [Candidatus Bathyarchaeota archaeon]|nr:hypothetical protein [Candidatus Bathyarchaeota archaeon]